MMLVRGGENVKINEVEKLTQIPKKSIRYYEAEGLLSPQRESGNGYRNYSQAEVDALLRIRLLRRLGLPVEEIRRVFSGSLTLCEALQRQKIALDHARNDCEKKQLLCERMIDAAREGEIDANTFLEKIDTLESAGTRFTDIAAVDRKRKLRGVWITCLVIALVYLLVGAWILFSAAAEQPPRGILLLITAFILIPVVGATVAGRSRIKEIKGGEEDDLGQY